MKLLALPLDIFLDIVQEFEVNAKEEKEFWDAVEKLGNYLANQIDSAQLDTLQSFLSAWQSARRPIEWNKIYSLWTPEMRLMSAACSSMSITKDSLESDIVIDGHRLSVAESCEILFGRLLMIPGVGATNASKMLALAMPNLFVMWDLRNVRTMQGIGGTAKDYVDFLYAMQHYAGRLIAETSNKFGFANDEAILWLEKTPLQAEWESLIPRQKPLAKLLDEFNYWLPKSSFFRKSIESGKMNNSTTS